jgi:undecaprenyl phosphate-alpha-L-ara4N flippase subunit ArnE
MNKNTALNSRENKTGVGVFLMVCSSLCACFGQMFWKLSTAGSMLMLISGLALYGVVAVIMLVAYKFGKLSVLQPIMALNYVFAIFIGKIIFDEDMSAVKIGGIAAVIIGVVLIGGENE